MLIDRGDVQLSDDEIDKLLDVYQAQIAAGVQTIMISHSALNGVKMHENKEYIMKLKEVWEYCRQWMYNSDLTYMYLYRFNFIL